MSEDYLWDRSGEPDPEIVHLEKVLSRFGFPEAPSHFAPKNRRTIRAWWAAGIAAIVTLVLTTGFIIHWRIATPVTPWQLSFDGQQPSAMHTGQTLDTSGGRRASVRSDSIGAIQLETDSQLRLLPGRGNRQFFALDHGIIHALIWAPPTRFVVDTPSARTVDLGCQYTLRVTKDGAGFLTVETGWVAFQWNDVESFIPAGAVCVTRPGFGPETPHFLDAPEPLTSAVSQYERTGNWNALSTALPLARQRDGLTLWHLLRRTKDAHRAEVFDRFAALIPLPAAVTREAILLGDQKATNAAWNALKLGDMTWWREWKRRW